MTPCYSLRHIIEVPAKWVLLFGQPGQIDDYVCCDEHLPFLLTLLATREDFIAFYRIYE
jgi:hypothetical protein